MTKEINLNADMGEGFGVYNMGDDDAMLDIVNSANIACGFHAGDPVIMSKLATKAIKANIDIGAHPSFFDMQGFGRRKMQINDYELHAMVIYQIGALSAIAHSNKGRVVHIKPHGALNNMAAVDINMARVIARAIKSLPDNLILLAPATSCLIKAAIEYDIAVAAEIFADRRYDDNGNLAPRSDTGAVIHDKNQACDQILSFLEAGKIISQSGRAIATKIDSICVHGDGKNAIEIAAAVKSGLEAGGYICKPLSKMNITKHSQI